MGASPPVCPPSARWRAPNVGGYAAARSMNSRIVRQGRRQVRAGSPCDCWDTSEIAGLPHRFHIRFDDARIEEAIVRRGDDEDAVGGQLGDAASYQPTLSTNSANSCAAPTEGACRSRRIFRSTGASATSAAEVHVGDERNGEGEALFQTGEARSQRASQARVPRRRRGGHPPPAGQLNRVRASSTLCRRASKLRTRSAVQ